MTRLEHYFGTKRLFGNVLILKTLYLQGKVVNISPITLGHGGQTVFIANHVGVILMHKLITH